MIAIRDKLYPRLELEFEMLVGELPSFEKQARELPIEQFLEIWKDYLRGSRILIYMNMEFDNEKPKRNSSSTRKPSAKGPKVQRVHGRLAGEQGDHGQDRHTPVGSEGRTTSSETDPISVSDL